MCASPRRTFHGCLWPLIVVVVVVMVPPASATELGSIGHNMELQNPFADPFHKALNSLPLWMDLSNSSYVDSDASSTKMDDTRLRYYLPSPNSTGDVTEKCRWDVQQILNAQNQEALDYLMGEDRLWPIYLADSWGKVPDGMLSGNLMPLGMMEECTSLTVKEENEYFNTTFNGQYCFVVYGKNGPPIAEQGQGSQRQAMQPGSAIIGHIPNLVMGGGSSYGTCMPDSCSPDDFKISLNEVLTDGNEAFWVHCHTWDETQVWEAKDYAFIIVMGLIGFLVVLGAVVDLTINYLGKQELRKGPVRYLLVFSGYTNMSKIFHINTKESPTSIACLHGMRVLSMTWVIWGHQWAFTLSYRENALAVPYYFRDVIGQTILNAQVSVDSFFFLSGLLVGYGLMRNKDKMDLYNFIMFYIHRFIRLAPPIAAVCFFGATVARFFATGAMGESTYLMTMEFCNRNWFHDVFFISNLSQQYVKALISVLWNTCYAELLIQTTIFRNCMVNADDTGQLYHPGCTFRNLQNSSWVGSASG
ncbi:unnamed protein product [Meganyctiphanes norvegica]|uniref:Nose resistant-to-fluoxetine protein N-terminal domain-containing protein n=1 Tax=Meganyctiphanes norvegica TaxID=48144 RepID=A0AAV2Q310_MEGNR